MINLRSFLEEESTKFGFDIFLSDSYDASLSSCAVSFRFSSDSLGFKLKLSRSWKTTRIEFVPMSFASQTINYLCDQIFEHKGEIENILLAHSAAASDILFQIDGTDVADLLEKNFKNNILNFYIETMTAESSIAHGLLNQNEAEMLDLALAIFSKLLPKEELNYFNPDEVVGYPEGATKQVFINRYERDPRNRAAAIKAHGYLCKVCGFDFEENYGEIGREFIVVHHVVPVSKMGTDYIINPILDLVPLCANCHSMIHRHDPPFTVEELSEALKAKRIIS
jgi:5-methylcytosine-specific restriction protein A